MQKRRSFIGYFLLGVGILAGGLYVARPFLTPPPEENTPTNSTVEAPSNGISKEGEVVFFRNGQRLRKIDVEIAENPDEQAKGLMFRPYLADSVGMLFIFPQAAPQSFWMKNTMIPLDIIYADQNKKIVSIQKNAKPYSEENLPSLADAQYVVEVVGGYCDKYDIRVGDYIAF
ncbi:MAG: DUF192 domain-containing protein [Runella sp.]